jgi:hypothetical protein
MAKISASEMKRIMGQIKRRKLTPADLARRGLLTRTVASSATRRFDEFRPTLGKSGLEKLGKISEREQRAQLDRLLKNQMAGNKKPLAAIKNPFRYGIEERVKTLKLLSKLARPGQVDHVILDTPFLIWAHPDSILQNSVIRPRNSSATLAFVVNSLQPDPGQDFTARQYNAQFWFVWTNNYGQEVMINAETFVTANGSCIMSAGFNTWNKLSATYGDVKPSVGFDIFELWNHNNSPVFEQGQAIGGFADMSVDAGRLYGIPLGNDESRADIFQTFNPMHSGFFTVPRNGSVLFEVYFWFYIFISAADFFDLPPPVVVVFADNFIAQCPFVHLEVMAIPIVT